MAKSATTELIADFLLRYYREPMRHRAQAQRAPHLYGNLDTVLRLALGRNVELDNPMLRTPAVAAELMRAAAFYIQQQFFREDATHYEVLGLATNASPDAVRENFRLLMLLIHPDRQGANAIWPESCAARANRAHAVLKERHTRAEYDREQMAAVRARDAAACSAARKAASPTRTRLPVRVKPQRGKRLYAPMLPEWLTADVGGFARRYPALIAFSGLIAMSALFVVATSLDRDGVLASESGYTPFQTSPAILNPAGVVGPLPVRPAEDEPPVVNGATPVPPLASASIPSPSEPQAEPAVQVTGSTAAAMPSAMASVPLPAEFPVTPTSPPPPSSEVAALIATFVSSYENGSLSAFANLFDDDAQTDTQRGRIAIRGEYDRLFQSTAWRRMRIVQMRWQAVYDRTEAHGLLALNIGWPDGRETEQRVSVSMDLVRHGGRTVIARLSQQAR